MQDSDDGLSEWDARCGSAAGRRCWSCGVVVADAGGHSGSPVVICRIVKHLVFFFSSRRRHTRCSRDWSSDVCSSDLEWMEQMARNVTMEDSGFLIHRRYLLHDHDSKYSSFRQVIEAGSVKTLALPPRSPNLNAYAERWVRSVREECLAKLILLGEGSLRRALRHYEAHYHEERNHQGKNNVLLFPLPTQGVRGEQEKVRCRERLGGLLKYYEREAA